MSSLPTEECYEKDGSPIKCPECGATGFDEVVRNFIDMGVPGGGPDAEIEYFCVGCGTGVAYWAYGYFDPAYYTRNSTER